LPAGPVEEGIPGGQLCAYPARLQRDWPALLLRRACVPRLPVRGPVIMIRLGGYPGLE